MDAYKNNSQQKPRKCFEIQEGLRHPHHSKFIETQNHCPLCGNELDIQVVTYLEDFTIREEAFCHSCNLRTRSKDHKMH